MKEIKQEKNTDGSTTIYYSDGSIEISFDDGSGKWISPDKSIQEWDSSGNPTVWKGSDLKSDQEIEFPINTKTACQLKWSHSTVFLTTNNTASCHRVNQNSIPENFDFHNTPEKLAAREKMLNGEWPGHGCEYCKIIEDANGYSDRMMHRKYAGLGPPPELEKDPTATHVTPRWLEVYFSNLCNLACIYCGEHFSSTWEAENKKFGVHSGKNYQSLHYTDALFQWLDSNIHHLYNLIILGGEPFLQPQSDRLLDFLETKTCPELTLTFFSNLSVDHKRVKKRFDKMQQLKKNGNIKEIHVVGSLDGWGKQAEYIRYGLNLEQFKENFEYLLYNTSCRLNINMAWNALSTFSMRDLINQINFWNEHRTVYCSVMTTHDDYYDNTELSTSPKIFGNKIKDWGFDAIVEEINTSNIELERFREHLIGLGKSITNSTPNQRLQISLHNYLTELDRRRGTDYTKLFPELYEEIKHALVSTQSIEETRDPS